MWRQLRRTESNQTEPMFDAFENTDRERSPRRTATVTALAFGLYAAVGALALRVGHEALAPELEVETEIHFAPPPPPPPPPPAVAPTPPPVVAAAPPPARAARPPLLAPRKVPKAAPTEADPGTAQSGPVEAPPPVEATAPAVPTPAPALVATAPPPEPPRHVRPAAHAPLQMTEGISPPEPAPENAQPEFPEEARAAGKEGVVVLKFVVTVAGTVEQIQVLKGEPPFVDAAVAAVRTWRFRRPAMLDGSPVPVFRIVPVRFRVR